MAYYLGIDTSNYTSSVSLFHSNTNQIVMQKRLLPVASNAVGLRQSDAVFAHVKQLHHLIEELFREQKYPIKAVGVSTRPRSVEGSYMPAFLVGDLVASSIASVLGVKKYECSHQEGHIVAALYSASAIDLLNNKFLAFHVSGGTTECLLVEPKNNLFDVTLIAKTLDLNAGQLIDRVGVMLGLQFPCGKALTELALQCNKKFKIKPTLKGHDIHLSGVQNQCETMYQKGVSKEEIARYVIEYIKSSLEAMTKGVQEQYGQLPLLYAGGVMSNTIIKEYMSNNYNGLFASPEFSADNAAGVSIITAIKDNENGQCN
ncbi:peptidase M22 [Paludicola sp. MB14-C6]|uniref:peptidase M22 n=1 Tax=Paludihabitans sp. MB14-C6 TaxID=3070656 RepID=UPI0027DE3ED8|nr:peptidase M22 [Paludicola sp. MB14-C6]WMJ23030.1 peptidase M22 [Paludicola sp. MB14-C6]